MNHIASAAIAAAALAGSASATGKECRTVRILEDGTRLEGRAGKSFPGTSASTSASATGSRSASASSSVSSSSSSDGASSSRSTSSTVIEGKRRRVTTTNINGRCTVIIDERDDQGD